MSDNGSANWRMRITASVLCAAIACMLLTACGGGSSSTSSLGYRLVPAGDSVTPVPINNPAAPGDVTITAPAGALGAGVQVTEPTAPSSAAPSNVKAVLPAGYTPIEYYDVSLNPNAPAISSPLTLALTFNLPTNVTASEVSGVIILAYDSTANSWVPLVTPSVASDSAGVYTVSAKISQTTTAALTAATPGSISTTGEYLVAAPNVNGLGQPSFFTATITGVPQQSGPVAVQLIVLPTSSGYTVSSNGNVGAGIQPSAVSVSSAGAAALRMPYTEPSTNVSGTLTLNMTLVAATSSTALKVTAGGWTFGTTATGAWSVS